MGGSSSSHQTSSNTINPAQMAQYQQNYAGAQNVASNFQPYTGPLTAGFNPTQIQAQGVLSGIATDPRYAATSQNAINSTQGVMNANLPTTITPSTYNAAQVGDTDLTKYLNPYTNDVVNTTLADLQHARDQQQVSDNAAATAAGAFGGTRQSVLNANTTNDYLRNVASTAANLRSGAYTNAQNVAASDVAARNAASQFNATQTQNASQNSFANALAAAGLRLNAAGQLESLNQADLARAAQQAGILSAVGDTQQQQQQQEYTNEYNRFLQNLNIASQAQQLRNQALGIIPIEQTTTTDSQTHTNPGVGGILGGIASLGLAAATGGSSLGLTSGLGALGGIFGKYSQTPAFTTNGVAYY